MFQTFSLDKVRGHRGRCLLLVLSALQQEYFSKKGFLKKQKQKIIPAVVHVDETEMNLVRDLSFIFKLITYPGQSQPAIIPDNQISQLRFMVDNSTDEILIKAGGRNELLAWYYFDNPVFEDIYSAIWGDALSLGNAKVVVESEDGEVLRTWSYEGREDEGRQFFNSKDWLSFVPTSGTLAWEFTILPEDLVQE